MSKICRDCKHYMGMTCKKYYNIDIVTGKKSYYYARAVRENEKKCGEIALHFEKNHYKIVTRPFYFMKNNPELPITFGILSMWGFFISFNSLK